MISLLLVLVLMLNVTVFGAKHEQFDAYGQLSNIIADGIDLTDGSTLVAIRAKNGGFITATEADADAIFKCILPQDTALWRVYKITISSIDYYYFKNYIFNCYLSAGPATSVAGDPLYCTSGDFIGLRKRWDLTGDAEDFSTVYPRKYMVPLNQKYDERIQSPGNGCTNNAVVGMGTTVTNSKVIIEVIAENV